MPSARTTVVVRGRPNAQQAAGRDGGLKLMEIKGLRERGHRITLLDDKRFWRLVDRTASRSYRERQAGMRPAPYLGGCGTTPATKARTARLRGAARGEGA